MTSDEGEGKMRIGANGAWHDFISAKRATDGPLLIDLRALTWADPVIAAGTATVAQQACDSGRQVRFMSPQVQATKGYLARMRLGRALDDLGVAHDLPTVNERDQQGNLLELMTFSTESDGDKLGELVQSRLKESPGVDGQILEPLHEALAELALNTATHADVDHGYAVAQTYPSKKQIKFCIADGGIGFRASLDRNPGLHPVDDAHALEMAVMKQLSGTDDSYRGYGLDTVVSTVRELGGESQIASGTAAAVYSRKKQGDEVIDQMYTSKLSSAYNGVIVQVTLPWMPGW